MKQTTINKKASKHDLKKKKHFFPCQNHLLLRPSPTCKSKSRNGDKNMKTKLQKGMIWIHKTTKPPWMHQEKDKNFEPKKRTSNDRENTQMENQVNYSKKDLFFQKGLRITTQISLCCTCLTRQAPPPYDGLNEKQKPVPERERREPTVYHSALFIVTKGVGFFQVRQRISHPRFLQTVKTLDYRVFLEANILRMIFLFYLFLGYFTNNK